MSSRLSPESCRSSEPLGSRCKRVQAWDKSTPRKSVGSARRRGHLGTERPRGRKIASGQAGKRRARAATRSAPRSSQAAAEAGVILSLMHDLGSDRRGGSRGPCAPPSASSRAALLAEPQQAGSAG
uniref:Uncharacterized protein n=1 Tax=Myotis myotis TaxID=51298 RepID=A0A7J7VYQ1_MYOMY|nr:hypothetical protein mMyoMyo1_012260 [Myotis myotis]